MDTTSPQGDLSRTDLSLTDHRLRVIGELASLLEDQGRTRRFSETLGQLTRSMHGEIVSMLEHAGGAIGQPGLLDMIAEAGRITERLGTSFDLLLAERSRQWNATHDALCRTINDFDDMFSLLSNTLVERELLERQSQVLEQIILSHERIGQWKAFVQAILNDFHSIFPFDLFFVALAENNGLMLNVYYFGDTDEAYRLKTRQELALQMIENLGLPPDSPLDYEEFHVLQGNKIQQVRPEQMITVRVPEHSSQLAGLLGVTFLSSRKLNPREESVIRSILAVMVMVVGSSKVLSRTLGELEYYSTHDPLTGLHNRRHFNNMLEYEIGRSERHQHEFAMLLLDLDDFKDVNDSYGHPTGDSVLVGVAEILRNSTRKGDLATRIGGDEFAILLMETGTDGAVAAAEKLGAALREARFSAPNGKQFHITTSIGIVVYPRDARTEHDLLAGVDIAMYRAKELGKDSACTLASLPGQLKATRVTRDFAEQLRTALREERMVPYFQPIVGCLDGAPFACETVARLKQENGETIAAGAFIDTIEKYGLGRELDRVIIRQAFQAIVARREAGLPPMRVFINLSAQEIQGRGILGYAEELCHTLDVPPELVIFEILERDAIGDMTNMRKFLANLRAKGFSFALDDFGSGYNSFHYLRELHFEYVKIDGAFVRSIVDSAIDRALVRNLANLCKELGIQTIAEFVESEEILNMLKDMGIDYVQGYHIGMPRPVMP
ncbi:EAL domain-containing protein [Azoarcus communis]|uniref:putative bifunctional diguanylate cyclase/phosphodiesterase n=1 Tax=Parazoarcus communis TaxID=41977 RepID=UPI0014595932|nr:bifunctional diguanylate cyclase/phosphodiesterase [Parazoarcus communis]NMG47480.1 EAL domain-containing protein [Parazoarcus communis]